MPRPKNSKKDKDAGSAGPPVAAGAASSTFSPLGGDVHDTSLPRVLALLREAVATGGVNQFANTAPTPASADDDEYEDIDDDDEHEDSYDEEDEDSTGGSYDPFGHDDDGDSSYDDVDYDGEAESKLFNYERVARDAQLVSDVVLGLYKPPLGDIVDKLFGPHGNEQFFFDDPVSDVLNCRGLAYPSLQPQGDQFESLLHDMLVRMMESPDYVARLADSTLPAWQRPPSKDEVCGTRNARRGREGWVGTGRPTMSGIRRRF